MPEKKRKGDYKPHISIDQAPRCRATGCSEAGAYKAPKSPYALQEYDWYCLDHIREVNKKWNFFLDMNQAEIEAFMKDAVTGHRPTWSRESQVKHHYEQLRQAVDDFLDTWGNRESKYKNVILPKKMREAMAIMDIEEPFTAATLKRQYRILVKKYHPDLNKGSPAAEERFKDITAAYLILTGSLKKAV